MSAGAKENRGTRIVRQAEQQNRRDLRRGTGGGFSRAACCFARVASWESEALRKRSIENRRCLGVSSWIGGDSGLANRSDAEVDKVGRLGEEEGKPSFGGVAGGAGMATRGGPDSWTGERGAEVLGRPEAEAGRECSSECVKELLLQSLGEAPLRSEKACFRISDSLAMTPRRRRNGMVEDHMWVA